VATDTAAPVSSTPSTKKTTPSNGGTTAPAPAPPKDNTALHRVEKGQKASDIGQEYGNSGKTAGQAVKDKNGGKLERGDVVEVELSDKARKNRDEFRHANNLRSSFGAFDADGDGEVSQQEVRDGKKRKGQGLDNYLTETYGDMNEKLLERRREAYTDAAGYYSKDANYAQLAQAHQGDETDGVTVADAQANRDEALEKLPEQQRKRIEGLDNRGALRTLNRDFKNFDTAAHGGLADGNVSENDLRAILDNPEADARNRFAAQYLLDNPDRLKALDRDGGDIDLVQSDLDSGLTAAQKETLKNALNPEAVEKRRAELGRTSAQTLNKDFAQIAGQDQNITRDDLRTILNSEAGAYSAEQRDAARYLLQNPEFLTGADTAWQNAKGDENPEADGVISQDDIRAHLTNTERAYREEFTSPKAQKRFQAQELNALRGLDNYFLHNGQDLSLENLRRLQESGDPREQKSASFFLKNLGELYALDGAADDDRRVDDKITAADVQQLLAQFRNQQGAAA